MKFKILWITFYCFLGFQTHGFSGVPPMKVGDGAWPDVAIDREGNAHIVYYRVTSQNAEGIPTEGKLFYRLFTASKAQFGPETFTGISTLGASRSDPEVVVDSQNQPHVFVSSDYAYLNGTTWKTMVNINPTLRKCSDEGAYYEGSTYDLRDTAMAIDGGDNIYVLHRCGNNDPNYSFMGVLVKKKGTNQFVTLPDPSRFIGVMNSPHHYGHIFISPTNNSLHIVMREGPGVSSGYIIENEDTAICSKRSLGYVFSENEGQAWAGGGITCRSNRRREGPSGVVDFKGTIYIIASDGYVYKKIGNPNSWSSLGLSISADAGGGRDLPALAVDQQNNLYSTCFGGKYNILRSNQWMGEKIISKLSTKPMIGFAELSNGGKDFVYAVWEEGANIDKELGYNLRDIVFATIGSDGTVGGGSGTVVTPPPTPVATVQPPKNVRVVPNK